MPDNEAISNENELLSKVKLSLRIMTTAFDEEINDLIEAAILDMGIAGVDYISTDDKLIVRAIITYCKMNFGESDNYAVYKQTYDEQKAQLSMATGYTEWTEAMS